MLRPERVKPVAPLVAPVTETIYGEPGADGQFSEDERFVKVRKQIDSTNWDEATTWFDGLGRTKKAKAKDSQGDVFTETKYDLMGRVEKVTNPYRQGDTVYWSKTRYDDLGRAVESFAPAQDGQTGASLGLTSFSISTQGLVGTVVTSTDASNRRGRSITNALGQLLRVDEPTSAGGTADADLGAIGSPIQPTFYQYDERGNLKEVNQGGQTRTFTYDSFSRIKSANNPESGLVQYTYDIFGNLKTKRDARGIKTIYDYDKWSRIIKRCYRVIGTGALGATNCTDAGSETVEPNTADVSYFYDGKGLAQAQSPNYAKGKLTKVSNSVSETLYTSFDNFGRLLAHQQITNGQTYSTSYKYNFSGALAEQTYPSGRVVRNFRDSDGDLSSVVANGKIYASDFSYTSFGGIEKMRLGNGNWESVNYNERLQPIQIGLGNAQNNTTNLWKVNYEYGELQADGTTVDETKNNGNIARQIITVPTVGSNQGFTATQTYTYDSLNRLKSSKEKILDQTNWQQTFGYDRFGNRNFDEANTTTITKACGESPNKFICDADRKRENPVIDTINNNNRFKEHQDGDGIKDYEYDATGNMTKDAEGRRFTYDALNKQTQVKDAGNQPIGNYFYDGEGKRVKKTGNLENTLFVYDGFGSLIAEYAIDNPPPNPSPNISYLTTDTLGSPRIITGKNGEVLSRCDFLPFGEEIAANENNRKSALGYNYGDATRQAFTGYEKDAETDLEFAQNRYYSNRHGRFTSPDPMMASGKVWNPQSWNRYAYVNNNPLNSIDPLGLDSEKTAWWYMPCAGCSPLYGTGYTDASQLINPMGLIYTNLAVSPNLWALNPLTGAAQSFANTADGMAEALKWMAAGGAAAGLLEASFAGALAGLAVGLAVSNPETIPAGGACSRGQIQCLPDQNQMGETIRTAQIMNMSDEEIANLVPPVDTMSNAPPVSNTAAPNPDGGGGQDPNKPKAAPKVGVKTLVKSAGLPTQGRIRYVPPKNVNVNQGLPRDPQGGYMDRFGNIWRRPRGQIVGERHWDVQLSPTGKKQLGWASQSGNHINVSNNGRILH